MNTSKIIRAVVGGRRYIETAAITKEDYGRILKIEGIELPETYEIDFSNDRKEGTSVTMIGNADGVLIPQQFIKSGKDIYAFYYHVGEEYGMTTYIFHIPNHVRPDRTEETPEPEQQSVIDQTIAALNTAVAQTAQDVLDADASAQSASASASSAAQSAASAAESAQGTEEYATRAEAAQTAAETAQSAAETAAATAIQKASQASSAESAAASAAQTATAKAIEAAQIVEGVEGYAESAAASASQAQASAQTASTKASEASASASTATTKATEATTAATTATTAKDDAVSAKNAAQTAKAAAETAQEAAEDAQTGAEAAKTATEGMLNDKAPVILETASGSIASFSDGADGMPMKSFVVDIEPVQSGSGDPSPDNVRPISGWTGATVQRTGVNLLKLDESEMVSKGWDRIFPISLKAGTYVISCQNQIGASVKGAKVDLTDENDSTIIVALTAGYTFGDSAFIGITANITEDQADKIKNIRFALRASGTTYNDIAQGDIQLELASTATDYEPYQGNTYTIDWTTEAGTVYGGHIDVVSGELVVDRANIASYNGETLPSTWISDRDVYAEGTTPTTGAQVVYKLATPITYHLTPTEVQSILGQNHVWSDTGDVSVEYRANTKLYIQRLTQPDTADMIADANITNGQYFMVGNDLYKATTNIANGASIIVGTNCTRKSLSEALNEINA